jgi:hypothetical protein
MNKSELLLLSSAPPTPENCQVLDSSVTPAKQMCLECSTSFTPASKVNRFCSSPCRQAAYRKSPAHRACLDGLKNQRLNRRNDQVRRRNKFKYLSFDGLHSGLLDTTVPSIGQLNLKRYAKVVA